MMVAGLLLAALGIGIVKNWDAFALMMTNMRVMGEGASAAEEIRYPEDLVDYLVAHPEQVSLVAYDVGAEAEGIFYQADAPRPLTTVPRLMLLATYTQRMEAGQLDPDRRVALDTLAVYALPGGQQQRHERARTRWIEAGHVASDSTVALRHVVRGAIQYNDAAAADWLMQQIGLEALHRTPAALGMTQSEPPLPSSGQQLVWSQAGQVDAAADRVDSLSALPFAEHAAHVFSQMTRLRRDTTFRRAEWDRIGQRGSGLSLQQQRTLAQHTAPVGTAVEYARLLERVVTDSLAPPGTAARMQEHLERAFVSDSIALTVEAVGSEGGATPGLISFAGYAHRADGAPPRIVVLFMEQVPMAVFYHLMQTGLDKGFQLQLMGDDAFFRQVRARLEASGAAASE